MKYIFVQTNCKSPYDIYICRVCFDVRFEHMCTHSTSLAYNAHTHTLTNKQTYEHRRRRYLPEHKHIYLTTSNSKYI